MKKSVLMTALALLTFGCGGPPPLSVTRPANGEVLVSGTQQRIEWVTDSHQAVDIVLSLPDGSTTKIASGTENTGAYVWSVPLLHTGTTGGATLRVVPAGTDPATNSTSPGLVARALTSDSASGFPVGSFASLQFNATSNLWEYYWTNVATGETTVIGTVGDVYSVSFPQGAAIDNDTKQLFVVGSSMKSAAKVYTMNSITGELLHDVALPDGLPTSIAVAQGKLLGFRWNGVSKVEEVVEIDPLAGTQKVIGTLGDLAWWSGGAAVDDAAGRLYALGQSDMSQDGKLYKFDTSTGAFLDSVPITLDGTPISDLMGAVVNSSGALLACRWNGTKEDLVRIDTTTGVVKVLGSLDDLHWWSGTSALNPSNDNFYVVGNNDAANFLYVMDARTSDVSGDRFLYKVGVASFPTGALLAY